MSLLTDIRYTSSSLGSGSRLHRRDHPDFRVRHWIQQRHLQRRQCRVVEAAAGDRGGAARRGLADGSRRTIPWLAQRDGDDALRSAADVQARLGIHACESRPPRGVPSASAMTSPGRRLSQLHLRRVSSVDRSTPRKNVAPEHSSWCAPRGSRSPTRRSPPCATFVRLSLLAALAGGPTGDTRRAGHPFFT